MKGSQPVAVIEAAYAIDRPTPEWLAGVVQAVAPVIDAGNGASAALYDASKPEAFRIGPFAAHDVPAQRLELLESAAPMLPYSVSERTFLTRTCGTLDLTRHRIFIQRL